MATEIIAPHIVDGLYRDRYCEEDGTIYRVRDQVNRGAILAANQLARSLEKRRTDGMRWALQIPADDYADLVLRNPELIAADREIKDRAWRKFIASPESLPYRIWDQAAGRCV